MLGIAYAASIGGFATIIGTPPNVFLISFVRDSIAVPYRMEISFVQWMIIGVPLAFLFLPLVWYLLTRWLFPVGQQPMRRGRDLVRRELRELGPPNAGEIATFGLFLITALLWIFRPLLVHWSWQYQGATVQPLAGLTDAGIVMITAMAMFVIPIDLRRRQFVMDWNSAKDLPWGVLVLFGGGLSLATACQVNGVADFLGSLSIYISGIPTPLLVLSVTAAVILLTELTSNTATTATLLPVLAALARAGCASIPVDLSRRAGCQLCVHASCRDATECDCLCVGPDSHRSNGVGRVLVQPGRDPARDRLFIAFHSALVGLGDDRDNSALISIMVGLCVQWVDDEELGMERPMRIWIVFALLACCAIVRGGEDPHTSRRQSIGQPVESFALQDFRGRQHSLADFHEDPLLVVAFLGTECPLAKLYAPDSSDWLSSFSHREWASLGSIPIRRTRLRS